MKHLIKPLWKYLLIVLVVLILLLLLYHMLQDMYLWDPGVSMLCKPGRYGAGYTYIQADRSKYSANETVHLTVNTAFAKDMEAAYPVAKMVIYLNYNADSGLDGTLEDRSFVLHTDFGSELDVTDVPDEEFVVRPLSVLISPQSAMPFSFDMSLSLKEATSAETTGTLSFTLLFYDAFDNPCGSSTGYIHYYHNADRLYFSDIDTEDAIARGRFVP